MTSVLRRRGGSASHANREQYIRLMQETLPELGPRSIKQGTLRLARRRHLLDAVDAGEVKLPPEWIPGATRALQLACVGLVPQPVLERNDYFLCSLIHPTFIAAGAGAKSSKKAVQLRRTVAMPLETSLCGRATLRALGEVVRAHQEAFDAQNEKYAESDGDEVPRQSDKAQSQRRGNATAIPRSSSLQLLPHELPPSISAAHVSQIPRVAGLEKFLLYDPAFFPLTEGNGGVPGDVLLAAATSLCGAIDLCQGSQAVAAFLDRMLARVTEPHDHS